MPDARAEALPEPGVPNPLPQFGMPGQQLPNIHVGPRPPAKAPPGALSPDLEAKVDPELSWTERLADGRLKCRACDYVNWDIPTQNHFMSPGHVRKVREVTKGARAKTAPSKGGEKQAKKSRS